jgi:hypothetical protein
MSIEALAWLGETNKLDKILRPHLEPFLILPHLSLASSSKIEIALIGERKGKLVNNLTHDS